MAELRIWAKVWGKHDWGKGMGKTLLGQKYGENIIGAKNGAKFKMAPFEKMGIFKKMKTKVNSVDFEKYILTSTFSQHSHRIQRKKLKSRIWT